MFGQFRDFLSDWFEDRASGDAAALSLQFSYEELAVATEYYSPQTRLGAGAAGEVFRGCLRGDTEVAVKVLSSGETLGGFETEVAVLSRFRHPNLVILLGWGQHVLEDTKLLVYELMPGGSVGRKLYRCKHGLEPFHWGHRVRVAFNAACGLSYMLNCQPRAFHRDIKVSNILLDSSGTAKLSDFGLAGIAKHALQTRLRYDTISGTPGYLCPEYLRTGEVTENSEVYSFGVVLLELLTNELPAKATKNGDILYPIMQAVQPDVPGAHSRLLARLDQRAGWPRPLVDEFAALALCCVNSRVAQRPSLANIATTLRRLSHLAEDVCNAQAHERDNPEQRLQNVYPHQDLQMCDAAAVCGQRCQTEIVLDLAPAMRNELLAKRHCHSILPGTAPCDRVSTPPMLSPPPSPRPSHPTPTPVPVKTPPRCAVATATPRVPQSTRPPPPPKSPPSPPPLHTWPAARAVQCDSFGAGVEHHAACMRSLTDYVPRVARTRRGARGTRIRQRSLGPRVLHCDPQAQPRADEPLIAGFGETVNAEGDNPFDRETSGIQGARFCSGAPVAHRVSEVWPRRSI